MHDLDRGKKLPPPPKKISSIYAIKKLPRVNDRLIGEKSPNLVTLPNNQSM
jgi:hypothetical protein